jgi:hypothetical protein
MSRRRRVVRRRRNPTPVRANTADGGFGWVPWVVGAVAVAAVVTLVSVAHDVSSGGNGAFG